MKEIIEKLYENRQIELAKSILEAHGYRYKLVPKSTESIAKALKTRVWSDKYTHVFSLDHKSILYTEPGVAPENQRYVGVIHAPFSDGEDEYMYVPWIWDTQDEYHDPESPEEFEFSTEAEAKKWVEDWFRKNGSKYNESKNLRVPKSRKVKESIGRESVKVWSSSEHTQGNEYATDNFYGYLTIEHPRLGEFMISASIEGDIRTDGQPWRFLQDENLTSEQIHFIRKYKTQLADFARTGNPSTTLSVYEARRVKESKKNK